MRKTQFYYWLYIIFDVLRLSNSKSLYIQGYPRSGTNWVTELSSAYLRIPISEPWKDTFPKFKEYIFHVHRFIPFSWIDRRTLYLVRDGRDVMVSFYFMILRDPQKMRMRKKAERFMKSEMSVENIKSNLPEFVKYLMQNKTSSIDYTRHVSTAIKRGFVLIKYEELLYDGPRTFSAAFQKLDIDLSSARDINKVFEEHSFKMKSGREPGQEDTSAFHRKGIAGDWKNYFSPRAAKVFDEYAGSVLIQLGYENSHDWVRETTD